MNPSTPGEFGPEVEDALDDRWTYEQTFLGRALFYVALGMLALVGVARLTGHMDLVHRNADLMAIVAGVAGLVWTRRDVQRGVTRFGHHGYWEVRREEHPVWFRLLTTLYALCFVLLLVGGVAHRLGWLTL